MTDETTTNPTPEVEVETTEEVAPAADTPAEGDETAA